MSIAQDRAATGAAMLDHRVPGWHHQVDPRTLNMAAGEISADGPECGCVCAQLDAAYLRSLKRRRRKVADWLFGFRRVLGQTRASNDARLYADAAKHGFVADMGVSYPALTRAWRQEINRRREREQR